MDESIDDRVREGNKQPVMPEGECRQLSSEKGQDEWGNVRCDQSGQPGYQAGGDTTQSPAGEKGAQMRKDQVGHELGSKSGTSTDPAPEDGQDGPNLS